MNASRSYHLEVNFLQRLNRHMEGISGEVYGTIYSTGESFETGLLNWEEAWKEFEKAITTLEESGWELVSTTKIVIPALYGHNIIKSLYFKKLV